MTTRKHELREEEELHEAELNHHEAGDCLGPDGCHYCGTGEPHRELSVVPAQNLTFETDTARNVYRFLKAVLPIIFPPPKNPKSEHKLYVSRHCPSLFDDGKYSNKERKPKYVYVCSVFDYAALSRREEDLKFRGCDSRSAAFAVYNLLKDKKLRNLTDVVGDGYDEHFMSFDGSIDLGFRVDHTPAGGAGCVDISLCHMFYGK